MVSDNLVSASIGNSETEIYEKSQPVCRYSLRLRNYWARWRVRTKPRIESYSGRVGVELVSDACSRWMLGSRAALGGREKAIVHRTLRGRAASRRRLCDELVSRSLAAVDAVIPWYRRRCGCTWPPTHVHAVLRQSCVELWVTEDSDWRRACRVSLQWHDNWPVTMSSSNICGGDCDTVCMLSLWAVSLSSILFKCQIAPTMGKSHNDSEQTQSLTFYGSACSNTW